MGFPHPPWLWITRGYPPSMDPLRGHLRVHHATKRPTLGAIPAEKFDNKKI